MKPTPVGTLIGNSRSSGRASSVDISTKRTREVWRPRCSVPSPAARTLADQSEPGRPPTMYSLPSTVIGVTGVERGLPLLRPGTVSTTGPKLMPRCCIPIITLLTYFNHQGGRMRSLLDMWVTLLKRRRRGTTAGCRLQPTAVPGSYRHAVVGQCRTQACGPFDGRQRVDEAESAADRAGPAVGLVTVADHHGIGRVDTDPRQCGFEDRGIGFDGADLIGQHELFD